MYCIRLSFFILYNAFFWRSWNQLFLPAPSAMNQRNGNHACKINFIQPSFLLFIFFFSFFLLPFFLGRQSWTGCGDRIAAESGRRRLQRATDGRKGGCPVLRDMSRWGLFCFKCKARAHTRIHNTKAADTSRSSYFSTCLAHAPSVSSRQTKKPHTKNA